MQQVIEREIPLYKIKYYNGYLYRVVKRLFDSDRVKAVSNKKSDEQDRERGKFDSALSRAKNTVREVALCNPWEYFVTLTFDKRWDRYDLQQRIKELMQWIQNENKKGRNIRYVFVPEFHHDGAVHLHGLVSGIDVAPRPEFWPKSVNLKDDGSYYDIWPEFSDRYGYSSVEPVKDLVAVGFYTSKYITKSLADKAEMKGVHTYYRSKGLSKASEVGVLYQPSSFLDKCCKFDNNFYKFGFCLCEYRGNFVDLIEEEKEMFQNYVITDPVSGELVAMIGGDTEDEYVQEVLEAFRSDGKLCEVVDLPD